jgi:hypothetical protein
MDSKDIQNKQNERMAEGYFKKYKPYVQAFEKSLVSKATKVDEHLITQLGKQLDQWKVYEEMCEASGSLNSLGALPRIANDVISAVFSNSVLPVIATTQSIEEQESIVYFRDLRAESSKGNRNAGDVIADPRTGHVAGAGFASNQNGNEEVVADTSTDVDHVFTLASIPVYSQSLRLSMTGSTPEVYGEDVGVRGSDKNIGTILGSGMSGEINYETGEVTIKLAVAPQAGDKIFASYQQNLELAEDIPKIQAFLNQKLVKAKAYALKSVIGMFQQYTLKKRFGDSALDEMTMDLTREINSEIAADLIRQYLVGAQGSTNFSLTVPAGISERQHRESYAFRMADAERVMIGNAGRGTVKVMIVGTEHAALVRGLDGFQLLSDGNSLGAHIFGTYKGVTYVRVPDSSLLGTKEGIGLYTGASPLESAGCYCPFMPLTVTQLSPEKVNPLADQKAAATMAATAALVPQYATKLDLVA